MYRYNYLSHQQQKIREQDFAACQGELLCVAQHSAKWDTINVLQTTSYGAGLLAGVPAGIVDSVQGLVQLGLNPAQTLAALKSLITSDDLLGNASAAVKQSYLARVEAAEAQYQKAGASGSFNAGMEYGKLLTDAATLVAGGVGAIKGGALLTEKITAKLVKEGVGEAVNAGTKSMAAVERGVADAGTKGVGQINIPTGTVFDSIRSTQPTYPGSVIPKSFEIGLPNGQKLWVHGNATEHIAEYSASKAVTHTPEAVRLVSQEQLRSFQAALNSATKNEIPFGQRVTVDGWQLEIKPPRAAGELPTVIHARYLGSH